MDTKVAISLVEKAIAQLIDKEIVLLKRGLNELSLNGHLAKYLSPLFVNYDVDPEYNGDTDNKPNDRKALSIAKDELKEIGYRKINSLNIYDFTPDIIIHKRLTNESNFIVIEVKKDVSSKVAKEYDLIKLKHLTTNYLGNYYNYVLGVALILGTKERAGEFEAIYFQNGREIEKSNAQ